MNARRSSLESRPARTGRAAMSLLVCAAPLLLGILIGLTVRVMRKGAVEAG